MKATSARFKTVDEYLSTVSQPARRLLKEMRKTIQEEVPQAEQVISYNMPAFKWHGMLVWYAAFNKHIGFFPVPSAITAFKKDLAAFERTKGSVHFPLDKPLPLGVIRKIVKFRMKENAEHSKGKKK